ncbi:MAG: hypothetical protein ABW007_16100 [Chitinophagaceae bacterium]
MGEFGWTGVDLFFVLSGFLISSQLFSGLKNGAGLQLKEFYIKRSFRILPAYMRLRTRFLHQQRTGVEYERLALH